MEKEKNKEIDIKDEKSEDVIFKKNAN